MSVTEQGVQGYEYQYLATGYLVLQYMHNSPGVQVYVEAINKEDALVSMDVGTGRKSIEIQFKKTKSPISIKHFAEWICHFETKSVNRNLLKRMIDDPELVTWFVSSGRVRDNVQHLHVLNGSGVIRQSISKSDLNKLLEGISSAFSAVSPKLNVQRNPFCRSQAAAMKKNLPMLSNVLGRTYLLEQLSLDRLRFEINVILNDKFGINNSVLETVQLKLDKAIRHARDYKADVVPSFNRILIDYKKPRPVVDQWYVKRPDEDALLQQLKDSNFLFLTGRSFCGKSVTAKSIINSLIDNSASSLEYSHTTSIKQAEIFLKSLSSDDRVCLLEDPMGHLFTVESIDAYKLLEELVNNIPGHAKRYLLVTTNDKVLQNIHGASVIQWNDITVTSTSFAESVWSSITANGSEVTDSLFVKVLLLIKQQKPSQVFQPGHLSFLKKNYNSLRQVTTATINNLAFADAHKIQGLIEPDKNLTHLFRLFAITCTTVNGITSTDLQYLLLTEPEYLPGLLPVSDQLVTHDMFSDKASDSDDAGFPKYTGVVELSEVQLELISHLEEAGYIHKELDAWVFSHPVYFEVGHNLLKVKSTITRQKILLLIRKSVASLSYRMAVNAINTIEYLHDTSTEESFLNQLREIVFEGMGSIFPAVKTRSIDLLCKKIDFLTENQIEELNDQIESHYGSGSDYHWHDGIPFRPPTGVIQNDVISSLITIDPAEASQLQNELNLHKNLNSEEAWKLLRFYSRLTRGKKARISLTLADLVPLLNYDEAFIRERASFLLAASTTDNDIEFIRQQFEETNALILLETIKGVWRAFPYYKNKEVRSEVLQLILKKFEDYRLVIRSVNLLTQFDSGYSGHAFDWMYDIEDAAVADMWYVWGQVMPMFFKHAPLSMRYNTGRFDGAMEAATTHLPIEQNILLLESWVDWLCRAIKSKELREGYYDDIFSYGNKIFVYIPHDQRFVIVEKLLTLEEKSFIARCIRFLLLNWDILTVDEGTFVAFYILSAESIIHSVTLTTRNCPPEICELLSGSVQLFDLPPSETVENLGEEVTKNCLAIIFLDNYFSEVGDTAYDEWKEILLFYLDSPAHPLFKLAVRHLIRKLCINSHHLRSQSLIDAADRLDQLIVTSDAQTRDFMLLVFLEYMTSTRVICKRWLNLIIQYSSTKQKMAFAQEFLDNMEGITYSENFNQIPDELFELSLNKDLKAETIFLDLVEMIDPSQPEMLNRPLIELVFQFLEQHHVRIWNNFDWFRNKLEALGLQFDPAYYNRSYNVSGEISKLAIRQEHVLYNRIVEQFEGFLESEYLYKYHLPDISTD